MRKVYAFMRGGRIYTLEPLLPDPIYTKRKNPFKFIGFCDGGRCGVFQTKKEFEKFIKTQPDFPMLQATDQMAQALRAEWNGNYQAKELLKLLNKQ